MKFAFAATATAMAAGLVMLTTAWREPKSSSARGFPGGNSLAGALPASPGGEAAPSPRTVPAPLEANAPSQPQTGMPLPRFEPVSYDAPDAGAAQAVQPPDEHVAALQRLVAQSQQETDLLAQIDEQLAAMRQQAANEESQRLSEAEQAATQHAATLEALGILRRSEALLATGNWDGVDDELAVAEASLSGRTLLDVEAARESLAREDLFATRQYLAAALAERRVRR